MNISEGSRRLALLLGAVGTIGGSLFAFAELQSTMRQKANHEQFERLAGSQITRAARHEAQQHGPWEKYDPDPWKRAAVENNAQHTEVNNGGIKTIDWGEGFAVEAIETQDGQKLYPVSAPGAWSYVVIALLPVFGFVIPWGIVRASGWVVTGFVQPMR